MTSINRAVNFHPNKVHTTTLPTVCNLTELAVTNQKRKMGEDLSSKITRKELGLKREGKTLRKSETKFTTAIFMKFQS